MIKFTVKGSTTKTEKFLKNAKNFDPEFTLRRYAEEGVLALRQNTPKDSGDTANAWSYSIEPRRNGYAIVWKNSNVVDGVPIVILLQYGHATRSGTFVEGIDFINPAMKPIFEKISENIWKEVADL